MSMRNSVLQALLTRIRLINKMRNLVIYSFTVIFLVLLIKCVKVLIIITMEGYQCQKSTLCNECSNKKECGINKK